MVTMQGDCRCQRKTSSHIFFNLFLMFLFLATGHLSTAHPTALHVFAFTPVKEPSCWTVMTAAPAAWSPLLTVHVQTSSPAMLEHARHMVSHYISFPASSSSWHTLLQFKPQMSDVIVQWFQTHLSGLIQCLCSLSDLSSPISILYLADTLRHCFHLIFQWILSSITLNWPSFLSGCFQSIFKNKEKKEILDISLRYLFSAWLMKGLFLHLTSHCRCLLIDTYPHWTVCLQTFFTLSFLNFSICS